MTNYEFSVANNLSKWKKYKEKKKDPVAMT